MKKISITALAKKKNINSKILFDDFEKHNLITKDNNNHWILTNYGIKQGGEYKQGQYGQYIV